MANKNVYGWTYNKQGERVTVNAPVYSNGKKAKKPKTVLGKILDSVGFSHVGIRGAIYEDYDRLTA